MEIAIQIAVLVFAVVVHEVSHGLVAYRLGDPTAKEEGRLTLNPLPHIDPFFSVILPAFLILSNAGFVLGGAKPVPINPYYFKSHKRDVMLVSLAGPISNVLLAIACVGLLKLSQVFPAIQSHGFLMVLQYGVIINVVLAAFNLLPIPPLDGSKVLIGLLPDRASDLLARVEPYGFMILIVLLATGMLRYILAPVLMVIQFLIGLVL